MGIIHSINNLVHQKVTQSILNLSHKSNEQILKIYSLQNHNSKIVWNVKCVNIASKQVRSNRFGHSALISFRSCNNKSTTPFQFSSLATLL